MGTVIGLIGQHDEVELDITLPTGTVTKFKKALNIEYGEFHENCWQRGASKNNKVTLVSPTVNGERAQQIIEACPKGTEIFVSGLYVEGEEQSSYRGPLDAEPRTRIEIMEKRCSHIERELKKLVPEIHYLNYMTAKASLLFA